MQQLIKADVFFFVTTIAVILLTVGVIIALYYVIRILRNVCSVTERVEEGSKILSEDLSELRLKMKVGGISARLFSGMFRNTRRWFKGRHGTRRKAEHGTEGEKS